MKRTIQGAFWIVLYLLITLAPLFILLVGPRPAGRELWRDLSVGLAFCGLAMLGLQFVLTARFKVLKAPYGSDIVYFFHRQISFVTIFLIASHPILLFIFEPKLLRLLNLWTAPWAARFGVTAIILMVFLIGLSVWRKNLKLEYDRWRISHGILSILVMIFALIHMELRGYYLNSLWKQVFWALYVIFWIGVLAWVRLIKPFILIRKPYLIEEVIQERGNAWTVTLRPEGHSGLRFIPGQFAWITLFGTPFTDREHPFSFSGSAEECGRISFTIKSLGDFTSKIKELKSGQIAYVDGPYGAFSVDRHPHAKEIVFIAGGIGITPIMSMLRTLVDRKDIRPITLLYANKTLDSVTFYDEIESLKDRMNLKVIHVLESPPAEWNGERGFITAKMLEKYLPKNHTQNACEIFICGPTPMMDAVEKNLRLIKIPYGDFHSERFDMV